MTNGAKPLTGSVMARYLYCVCSKWPAFEGSAHWSEQWPTSAVNISFTGIWWFLINTLRPRQNEHHFADDIFKCIFFNKDEWTLPRILLKFVPKVRINNIPALVQIMAWRRPGDKPLSEPMMVNLLTHICVTRSQWVNVSLRFVLGWNKR